AQSNKLSTVSDNIANVNTTGYKRASTEFSSLILKSGSGNYDSGAVKTTIRYAITDPGNISFTTSAADLAVHGNRFFVRSGPRGQPLPAGRRLVGPPQPRQSRQCGRILPYGFPGRRVQSLDEQFRRAAGRQHQSDAAAGSAPPPGDGKRQSGPRRRRHRR